MIVITEMVGKRTANSIPVITGDGFKGRADLSLDDIKKLAVESFSKESIYTLSEDWSGKIAGVIGLSLSNDNKRVTDGKFFLVGTLCAEKKVMATKFWNLPDQPGTSRNTLDALQLSFSIPDCEIFKFPNGGLVSELVDGGAITHSFMRGDVEIPQDDLPESILGFSVRAYIIPTRETYAKIIILLYPLAKDMLVSSHSLSNNPMFPGITLFSGEFPLFPMSSTPPLNKNWGCPISPVIIPGMDLEDAVNFPKSTLLRAAISQVLRKALKPESKGGFQHLIPRWTELAEHGISKLKDFQLEQIWPIPAMRNEDFSEGRVILIFSSNVPPLSPRPPYSFLSTLNQFNFSFTLIML